VGNLSPNISEETLFREFQKFGAIQSVKIMWPRSEEEKARARHCGFVAFVNRADAAAAKDEMNETEMYGYVMRIGWGKAVAKPSPAITLANIQARAAQGAAALAGNAMPPPHAMGMPSPMASASQPPGGAKVVRPPGGAVQSLIDRLALFIAEEGHPFEQVIMEREVNNPRYNFMFDHSSAEHLYYRWKVVSLCTGGTEDSWDSQAMQLEVGGTIWTPPPCPRPPPSKRGSPSRSSSSSRSSSRSRSPSPRRSGKSRERGFERVGGGYQTERDRKTVGRELTEDERDDLEDMLRSLVVERASIKECMGFCISKAAASGEIVETITEALSLSETPVPKKIARLFLVSDVLHNSSAAVPNASSYRSHFQGELPAIFSSLHECYKNITSRMGIETMKEQVVKVLHIWQAWSLFPLSFVLKLERILLHGTADPPPLPPADAANETAADEGALGDSAGDGGDDDDDVDGEPMARPPSASAATPAAATPTASAGEVVAAPAALGDASVSKLTAEAEVRVKALTLREMEAVCEANDISSAGSRAEMMQRLLIALHAGYELNLEARPEELQTLAVATRWDEDDEVEAPAESPTEALAAAPAAAPAESPAPVDSEADLSAEVRRDLEAKLTKFAKSLEGLGRPKEWVDAQVRPERALPFPPLLPPLLPPFLPPLLPPLLHDSVRSPGRRGPTRAVNAARGGTLAAQTTAPPGGGGETQACPARARGASASARRSRRCTRAGTAR